MSLSNLRYEGRYVSAGEFNQIHVMEFGDGPPVVLVHGAGSGGPAWHRQIAVLARYHRVIVPDVPMFGMSDIPNHIYAPRMQIADVILGVMNELGIEATDIAGHSMGALGSVGAMTREPARFKRAVLVSSPGFGRGLNWLLKLASLPALRRFVRYDSRRDRHFFFDRLEAQKSGPSTSAICGKRCTFQVGNRNLAIDAFSSGICVSFASWRGQRDLLDAEDVAKVTASTLLVWGDSDLIIPTPSQHARPRNNPRSPSRRSSKTAVT